MQENFTEEGSFQDREEPQQLRLVNMLLCLGIFVGFLLGITCLVLHPGYLDSSSSIFLFTAFYICVEISSAFFSAMILGCMFCSSLLSGRQINVSELVSIYAVCTYNLSVTAHLAAVPIGPILLLKHPEAPLIYQIFIMYQVLLGILVCSRMVCVFVQRNSATDDPQLDHLTELQLRKAQMELDNVKSMKSMKSYQSEPATPPGEFR